MTDQNKIHAGIYWHGEKIGACDILSDDKVLWQGFTNPEYEKLFTITARNTGTGTPAFLQNLLPESDIFAHLSQTSRFNYVAFGMHFLSNFYILTGAENKHEIIVDRLEGKLGNFTNKDGFFTGHYEGPDPVPGDADFQRTVSEYWKNRQTARFSGRETKIPANLNAEGHLVPATNKAFTHFVKFPQTDDTNFYPWGINEWMCMQIARDSGLKVADTALLPLQNGLPPALLVERFDIPDEKTDDNKTKILMQDFCSLNDIPPSKKYNGSIEQLGKKISEISLNHGEEKENIRELIKRYLVSYLVNDIDMHRKNISMVESYGSSEHALKSVKLSPAYDITSSVYTADPGINIQPLSLSGKQARFKREDFISFGQKHGLDAEEVNELLTQTIRRAMDSAVKLHGHVTKNIAQDTGSNYVSNRIATIVLTNAKYLGEELDYDPGFQPLAPVKRGQKPSLTRFRSGFN